MPNRTALLTRLASRRPFASDGRGRAGLFAGLIFLASVQALASGCSSSSTGVSPFADFEGTWRVELGTAAAPQSVFSLNCTTTALTRDVPLWDRLVFERGTVSDLIETAGPADCQFPFQVDAGKTTASVPAVDPLTGLPVTCNTFALSGTDPTTMDALDAFLEVKPNPWTFQLFPVVKGKAPTAKLSGSSTGALSVFDKTTNMGAGVDSTCKYDLLVNLTKIAQD